MFDKTLCIQIGINDYLNSYCSKDSELNTEQQKAWTLNRNRPPRWMTNKEKEYWQLGFKRIKELCNNK